ncbi:antibiotic biosynthesis monooxygenase family protein [Streptomyces sp. NPDC001388]|uniref:antibiotic biosynthesis monooxygenase family protein n=1 Tax=unclassified Streptomyces TaxID=2593676 RepID=UPI0036B1CA9F
MITLINRFTVTEGRNAEFEDILSGITAYMTSRPGFLGHTLYRSTKNPEVYVETARWTDAASHREAMSAEDFRSRAKYLIQVAKPDPDLFEVIDEN